MKLKPFLYLISPISCMMGFSACALIPGHCMFLSEPGIHCLVALGPMLRLCLRLRCPHAVVLNAVCMFILQRFYTFGSPFVPMCHVPGTFFWCDSGVIL